MFENGKKRNANQMSASFDVLLAGSRFESSALLHNFHSQSRFPFTEEVKPNQETPSPSLVVISRPPVHFNPQPVTIDLSKTSTIPLTLTNGSGNSGTIYNIDESQTSLNLSAESSGYVSNSTSSSLGNVSLNQSAVNGDDLEMEKNSSLLDQRLSVPSQSTFSALPMPPSMSGGRRRTISSNSNR